MAKLAINGGRAVLGGGCGVDWPEFDARDERALLKVFRSGKWCILGKGCSTSTR